MYQIYFICFNKLKMSTKNTFRPSNWTISDTKVLTCWVNPENAKRATKFKLISTGKTNNGAGFGFGAELIKYTEFTVQINRDADIHKEQNGSTISWCFIVNGVMIELTHRNQYSNSNFRGRTRSVENLDKLFGTS